MEINENKLNELLGKMVTEMGAAAIGPLVIIGDKMDIYKTIENEGSLTSQELSKKTGLSERYLREWLAANAASGYINFDETNESFSMSPEQAFVFSNKESPVLMTGAYYGISSMYHDVPMMEEAFRTDEGVAWGDHHSCLFCGTEKFFRPSYEANLVSNWIPALEGVAEKLGKGAKVADVGCGHAASTMIMAKAYPNSEFTGFDMHKDSVDHAKRAAKKENIKNVEFEIATAKDFPGSDYDFITFFDCLHDMGDPEGVCRHVKEVLKPDGACMMVEPFANDDLKDNLNPVGRAFYSFSTLLCTPCSKSQEVGLALGAQAGEKRLGEVARAGGFSKFRRATETPFNLILEARP